MRLIVISNPAEVCDEALIMNDLFAAGLSCLHVRKPDWCEQQLRAMLKQIRPEYYRSISLHQHHHLAEMYGIRQLHYTEAARAQVRPADLVRLQEKGFVLSTSLHELSRLEELGLFDYFFFGPVFNSLSKPGYHSRLTPEFSLAGSPRADNIVALGGVEAARADSLKAMGFKAAAVLGAIWQKPEKAVATFLELQNLFLDNTDKDD